MYNKLLVLASILGLAVSYPGKSLRSQSLTARGSSRLGGSRVGIYDGTNTTIQKYPYLVSVVDSYSTFICAGVILSNKWVITDANAIDNYPPSQLMVVTGSSYDIHGTTYNVKTAVVHPHHNTNYLDYDYALLKIKDTFTWGETTGNVSLPSKKPAVHTVMNIAGWGVQSKGGTESGTLQEGEMSWLKFSKCKSMYSKYSIDWTNRMHCVYNKGKTTICDGDIGDPLVADGVLYGLAADGGAAGWCSSAALPAIVTNIYSVVKWIEGHISTSTQ